MTGYDEKAPPPSAAETISPLFSDLPGGSRAGLLLHAILERADLEQPDNDETREIVERQLALYGFDPALAARVQHDLARVVSTPLLREPKLPALGQIERSRQLRELEFTLAVTEPDLRELAKALRQHGAPAMAPRYHTRLADLQAQTLRGFLRGFIDLVFEWEGRWYVADYKSNRLPAYEPSTVSEAMEREHYVLQGLLYSAAANRYLRQRDSGYEPSKHWGGALFLFVRGMEGPARAGSSVFFDRQSPGLLAALESWLGGSDASR